MSNRSPVFPMPEPHHFTDYGFEPHFDYFQVVEEEHNHQREASSCSIDSIRFKLPKPNSNDVIRTPHDDNKKRGWWRKALFMMLFSCSTSTTKYTEEDRDVHLVRARAFRAAASSSVSAPVYVTESDCNHRMSRGEGSGCTSPYLSLRELSMEQQHLRRMSGSASPIYFVT